MAELTHQEYFAHYGIEIDEEYAEQLVQSVAKTAGATGHPTTLCLGRVVIQARPDEDGVEVEMGSLPCHPNLSKEPT